MYNTLQRTTTFPTSTLFLIDLRTFNAVNQLKNKY